MCFPSLLPTPSIPNGWIPDSSATQHMTPDSNLLQNLQPYSGADQVLVGDGKALTIDHIGSSSFPYLALYFLVVLIAVNAACA